MNRVTATPPPYSPYGSAPTSVHRDDFVTIKISNDTHKCLALVTSVALAAITATAAYFLLRYGFYRIDSSVCRMDLFVGGFSAYMGIAYAITAVVNTLIASCGQFWARNTEERESVIWTQVLCSVAAPLYFLPKALEVGICLAIFSQPQNR